MSIIVGVNSYVTEEELSEYAINRGITITGDKCILLIRSMDYLQTRSYLGTKTDLTQPLQFPRTLCSSFDAHFEALNSYSVNFSTFGTCTYDNNIVPNEIKNAQMIGAILVGQGYDLQPTIGQSVKREKVDVIEVEYQEGSVSGSNQFRALSDILKPFLSGSGMRASRV